MNRHGTTVITVGIFEKHLYHQLHKLLVSGNQAQLFSERYYALGCYGFERYFKPI